MLFLASKNPEGVQSLKMYQQLALPANPGSAKSTVHNAHAPVIA
jgi:hypothetical protein